MKSVVYALLFWPLLAAAQGTPAISFEQSPNWQQVLARAKSDDKYIFVDAVVTECEQCKKMDAGAFANAELVSYINKHFITVKIQMDVTPNDSEQVKAWRSDAAAIADEYKIAASPAWLPAYVFLSPQGQLVMKSGGDQSPDDFMAVLRTATGDYGHYNSLKAYYESGKPDYSVAPFLVQMATTRHEQEFADRVTRDYMDWLLALPEEKLYTRENLDFIKDHLTSTKDKGFRLFYPDSRKVDAIYGKAQSTPGVFDPSLANSGSIANALIDRLVIAEQITPSMTKATANGADVPWAAIRKTIAQNYNRDIADRCVINLQIDWYSWRKQWPQAVAAFTEKTDKYGPQSISGMNDIGIITSLVLIHSDDKKTLNKAVSWEKYIFEHHEDHRDDPMGFDDYGALLYKAGRVKEGIHAMEVHLKYLEDLKQAQSPGYQMGLDILTRMKKGEKVDESWEAKL
jgi:thioredoxin-related protein